MSRTAVQLRREGRRCVVCHRIADSPGSGRDYLIGGDTGPDAGRLKRGPVGVVGESEGLTYVTMANLLAQCQGRCQVGDGFPAPQEARRRYHQLLAGELEVWGAPNPVELADVVLETVALCRLR